MALACGATASPDDTRRGGDGHWRITGCPGFTLADAYAKESPLREAVDECAPHLGRVAHILVHHPHLTEISWDLSSFVCVMRRKGDKR
jgi:hypothetical protein